MIQVIASCDPDQKTLRQNVTFLVYRKWLILSLHYTMKKFIITILALAYFVSSAGATIHLHYCMDKLVNWSLSEKPANNCEKCGMEKDGVCCKDEHHFIKSSTDQKTAESDIHLFQASAIAAPNPFITHSELYFSQKAKHTTGHAPPNSGVDIHIRNCVFRI